MIQKKAGPINQDLIYYQQNYITHWHANEFISQRFMLNALS